MKNFCCCSVATASKIFAVLGIIGSVYSIYEGYNNISNKSLENIRIAQCGFGGIGLLCNILLLGRHVMPILIFVPVDFIKGAVFVFMVRYVQAQIEVLWWYCFIHHRKKYYMESSDHDNQCFYQLYSSNSDVASDLLITMLILCIPVWLCFKSYRDELKEDEKGYQEIGKV